MRTLAVELDRVVVRRSTLRRVEGLLEDGDAAAALEVVRQVLDIAYRDEVREAMRANYRRLKDGRQGYEQYAEIRDLLKMCLL